MMKKDALVTLMKNLNWTPVQAMDALSVPEDERAMYLELLKHDQTILT